MYRVRQISLQARDGECCRKRRFAESLPASRRGGGSLLQARTTQRHASRARGCAHSLCATLSRTAAFRFGHSIVSGEETKIDDQGNELSSQSLADAFFATPADVTARTGLVSSPLVAAPDDDTPAQLVLPEDAGYGAAMAKFIQLVMRQSPLPDDYLDQPAPNPAQFGLPAADDGSRDDPLLGGNLAMPPFQPDADALRASSVRIVPAIGEAGKGSLARRGGEALAALLGVAPVVFPGDHGGFAANQWSPDNDPEAFAQRLLDVLAVSHAR